MSASSREVKKRPLTEKYFGGSVHGLDGDEKTPAFSSGSANDGARVSASASSSDVAAVAHPLALSSANQIVNPDPDDRVVISDNHSARFPKKFSPPSEPAEMDVDAGAKAFVKKTSRDEIIFQQLKQLGASRYLAELYLSYIKFFDEKTGDSLARFFGQHEIIYARFGSSNVFSSTSLSLELVGSHHSLCDLILTDCQLSPAQMISLFEGLSRSTSIVILVLTGTMYGWNKNTDVTKESYPAVFLALNRFLITNETLEVLHLQNNHLKGGDVEHFATGISRSPLKELWVSNNQMGVAGFCALLANFKGNLFDANNAMGDEKCDGDRAATQICETLATNPRISGMQVNKASRHWSTDAKIYDALRGNRTITSFHMCRLNSKVDDTTSGCVQSLCALLEAKTPLQKLSVDASLAGNFFERIERSVLRNRRLTWINEEVCLSDAISESVEANRIRAQIEEYNWQRSAVVIAFVRANKSNPLCYSILPLASFIARMNFETESLKKDAHAYQEMIAKEDSNKKLKNS